MNHSFLVRNSSQKQFVPILVEGFLRLRNLQPPPARLKLPHNLVDHRLVVLLKERDHVLREFPHGTVPVGTVDRGLLQCVRVCVRVFVCACVRVFVFVIFHQWR